MVAQWRLCMWVLCLSEAHVEHLSIVGMRVIEMS